LRTISKESKAVLTNKECVYPRMDWRGMYNWTQKTVELRQKITKK